MVQESLYEGMDIQSSNLVTVFSTGSNHALETLTFKLFVWQLAGTTKF